MSSLIPVAPAGFTLRASNLFQGANQNPIDPNLWTPADLISLQNLQVLSQSVQAVEFSDHLCVALFTGEPIATDQYCSTVVLNLTGESVGVAVRCTPANGTNQSRVSGYVFIVGSSGIGAIATFTSEGTTAILDLVEGLSVTPGEIITLTAVKNVLTAYINGSQILTATDSTYTSGYVGLAIDADSAGSATLGAWSAGDLDTIPSVELFAQSGNGNFLTETVYRLPHRRQWPLD